MNYAAALKSFLGHLEGTQKAAHTIKSYRLDLASFENFLRRAKGDTALLKMEDVTSHDLELFHSAMKAEGLRVNTRRRKLMTLRKFFSYLAKRNKITIDLGRILPAPQKVERVPETVSHTKLLEAIRLLPSDTLLLARNRAILWTLAETGCLVSEVGKLRITDFILGSIKPGDQVECHLRILAGKTPRSIPIHPDLYRDIQTLWRTYGDAGEGLLFSGFNKGGALGSPISSRGVELLVRAHADRLGFPRLVPRTFRHSAVVEWNRRGMSEAEIQERLGLRSRYAFKTYTLLFAGATAGARSGTENHPPV